MAILLLSLKNILTSTDNSYIIDRALSKRADVAQSVERILGKDEVTGSNPVISSTDQSEMTDLFLQSEAFVFSSDLYKNHRRGIL